MRLIATHLREKGRWFERLDAFDLPDGKPELDWDGWCSMVTCLGTGWPGVCWAALAWVHRHGERGR